MNRKELGVHVRWMIRRDMDDITRIEKQSSEFPWAEDDFIRCLRQRNCIGMVAERGGQLAGYMVYELHKTRIHLLNIAVAPEHQNHNVGRALVHKLTLKLSHERRNQIMLEVRETNVGAQLFFKTFGFKAISVLHDFYDDATEDAYLMQYRHLPTASETASPKNRIGRLLA